MLCSLTSPPCISGYYTDNLVVTEFILKLAPSFSFKVCAISFIHNSVISPLSYSFCQLHLLLFFLSPLYLFPQFFGAYHFSFSNLFSVWHPSSFHSSIIYSIFLTNAIDSYFIDFHVFFSYEAWNKKIRLISLFFQWKGIAFAFFKPSLSLSFRRVVSRKFRALMDGYYFGNC